MTNYKANKHMLSYTRNLKQFVECLRWSLKSQTPVQLNLVAEYTTFLSGAIQTYKRDPVHPALYYFEKTKPEKHVDNARCILLPFNCPHVYKSSYRIIK